MFVIANIQIFTSQIFGVVGYLGGNFAFFSPLGFDVQTNSDHKTHKIKLYSVGALKRCLNEKNLIHGRVMATISKFSPEIFEAYFNIVFLLQLIRYSISNAHFYQINTFDSDMLQLVGNHGTTADQRFCGVMSMSFYNIV